MIPIHALISRIQWDKAFAEGDFIIGYYDRTENKIIKVPFREIYLDPADHFFFQVTDAEGCTHEVPFHRVKEVYKNGKLIWYRTH